MKKGMHRRLFGLLAALLLSFGLLLSTPITAEAAGRTATVELRMGAQSLGMVNIRESQVLDVPVSGTTIRIQWLDPTYIELLIPGQGSMRLTVPNGPFGGRSGRGQLPVPSGEDMYSSFDELGVEQKTQGLLRQSADCSYLYFLGDVTTEQYATFVSYLNAVINADMNLMSTFVSNGWRIVLTSADLDTLLFNGTTDGVEGATYFPNKTIYINTGEYMFCFVHEMGHYLDYVRGSAANSNAFVSLYYTEGGNLTEYGRTTSEEFFAEVYSYLVLDPNTVYARCPQSAAYVQSCRY